MEPACKTNLSEEDAALLRLRFRSLNTWLSLAAGLLLTGLMTGCASTGVPRPPSLMLPQVVRAPQAVRSGGYVDLQWTTPTLTTDRLPLVARKHGAGALTAEVCRVNGPNCVVFARQLATAGEPASARDALGPDLAAGPARPVRYRVRILNGAGHSAGWSRDALAAAGEAPPAIAMLAAATTNRGMRLTWQGAPASPGDRILLQAASADGSLRVLAAPAGAGGTVDGAAAAGDTIRYTVQRTRTARVDGMALALNGEAATVTATVAREAFAPLPPRGLVAVAVQLEGSAPEIDLSWEANSEPDLQGYLVYRTEAGKADAPALLTAKPTALVSYQDTAVQPGHAYRYTVVAVDRAGNASPPSAAAEERLRQ